MCEGGGSELSDNNAGTVVGNLGCFLQRAAGAKCQCEEGDCSVPSPRHIKDFLGARRCVVGRAFPVERESCHAR